MPRDPDLGQLLGQRPDQGVPAAPVLPAHPAQVPVVAAGTQEVGQRVLLDDRGARGPARRAPAGRPRPGRRAPTTQPSRSPGRAPCSTLPDRITRSGRQALQAADRVAVEAELGVVVVLQDDAVARGGPLHQRGPAGRRQHHAGRVLVGGRDQDRVAPRASAPYVEALVVHRDRERGRRPPGAAGGPGGGWSGPPRPAAPAGHSASTCRTRLRPWATPPTITRFSGAHVGRPHPPAGSRPAPRAAPARRRGRRSRGRRAAWWPGRA